jgi:hypothetical protein
VPGIPEAGSHDLNRSRPRPQRLDVPRGPGPPGSCAWNCCAAGVVRR